MQSTNWKDSPWAETFSTFKEAVDAAWNDGDLGWLKQLSKFKTSEEDAAHLKQALGAVMYAVNQFSTSVDTFKVEVEAHAFAAHADGSVWIFGEDETYCVKITIPKDRKGAAMLAIMDATEGKQSYR